MIQLKTKEQIDGIRKSCHLLRDLFSELDSFVKEGLSTYDIDKYSHEFMLKHKATPPTLGYFGYPAATCVSVNDTVIHGIPSKKEILKPGDIVSIDICIDLNGYISDSTHTYEIGTVSKEVHKLNLVTRECLYKGIEAASQKGARIQNIGDVVFKHATQSGYGVVRDYTGHGVGLSLHEEPEVPNYTSLAIPNPRIREGMVFAIEPMINLGTHKIKTLKDGWTVKTQDSLPSAHWEHTVAITDNGLEILT